MLIKTKIALSALLVVGFASAALANLAPENKIGDRYPLLEQAVQTQPAAAAFAYAAAGHSAKLYTTEEQSLFSRAKGTW
jgi:hypothetical protein